MNVDTMSTIRPCLIVPQNMCVEERQQMNMQEEDEIDFSEEVFFSDGISPVQAVRVSCVGTDFFTALPGFIAAVREAGRFMDNKAEHDQTELLLIQHVREKYGKE